jgi:hypothetical protein
MSGSHAKSYLSAEKQTLRPPLCLTTSEKVFAVWLLFIHTQSRANEGKTAWFLWRGSNMQSGLTEYEVLRDIDRRIAELQNTHDRNLGNLKADLRLLHQDIMNSRTGILERLQKLEEKPVIDWQAIIQNFWFKLAVLAALATGNTQLIDLVTAAFQK